MRNLRVGMSTKLTRWPRFYNLLIAVSDHHPNPGHTHPLVAISKTVPSSGVSPDMEGPEKRSQHPVTHFPGLQIQAPPS
jgi:hypothetical protein